MTTDTTSTPAPAYIARSLSPDDLPDTRTPAQRFAGLLRTMAELKYANRPDPTSLGIKVDTSRSQTQAFERVSYLQSMLEEILFKAITGKIETGDVAKSPIPFSLVHDLRLLFIPEQERFSFLRRISESTPRHERRTLLVAWGLNRSVASETAYDAACEVLRLFEIEVSRIEKAARSAS